MHRVGRVARAGRDGVAYSLVARKDLPYVMDLGLFLGKKPPTSGTLHSSLTSLLLTQIGTFGPNDLRIGTVPRSLHENYGDQITRNPLYCFM